MTDYCVELKVCEGCGALFLRAANQGTAQAGRTGLRGGLPGAGTKGRRGETTCRGCALRLSEFPVQRERRRRGFELRGARRCAGTVAFAGGAR
jgi:hypothetical protein